MVATNARVLAQMRKGIVEFCVLAHLRHGEAYGREIAGTLANDPAVLTSEGTLYPLLARLRKQGWVETSWTPSDSGPPRRYYALTEDGAAALEAFTAAWGPFHSAVTAILEDDG
ncbi:MAG: PadR family transcriptional regulator [Nitriliruptoraceae bacterium]|nr:PadR family transcriptional regulator [Nitriliruptoraceae bacterium]